MRMNLAAAINHADDAELRLDRRRAPQTSVSIDWVLAQTGALVDGSVASLRFRENIESAGVSLMELEAWVLQALQKGDDEGYRHAVQDLVHAVAKRLGLKVQYGNYDRRAKGWLPFDGLWWLDSRSFACVRVHPRRLTALDLDEVIGSLERVRELGGIFAEARGTVVYVLAEGYTADLEPKLRSHAALESIRLLGVDTLFDVARMHEAGVLSTAQLPVLFSPFDSMRLGQVVDFLERFMSRFEESAEASQGVAGAAHSGFETVRDARTGAEAPKLRVVAGGKKDEAARPPAPGAAGAVRPVETVPGVDRRQRLEMLKEILSLFKASRFAECLVLLERFVSIDDSNPRAWEIYGDLSLKTGRHGEAIRAYSRVLSLAPPNLTLAMRVSRLYETQGDIREAVRVLEELACADPKGARDARLAVARLLSRAGDARGTVSVCDQLLAGGPWDREIVELREQSLGIAGKGSPRSQPAPIAGAAPVAVQGKLDRWLGGLLGRR